MSETFVIELGDAKEVTRSPFPQGCEIDGLNPVTYQKEPKDCSLG